VLVRVFLRFDRSFDVYDRNVKDFLTLLSDIGGLQKALFAFGTIFVSFFAQKVFMANIIRRVYQVRKYEEDDEDGLDVDGDYWNDINKNQSSFDSERGGAGGGV
jgi:hypothetical protein